MSRTRQFAQVDVFSSTPYGGNPVAVILDAEGMSSDQMQRVARWTNLSETTFVLPPTTADADYRVRIFTPARELPFAGHPTLGTARAWLDDGGNPARGDVIIQECRAGLVSVRASSDRLWFAAPDTTRSGPLSDEDLDRAVKALGVDAGQVIAHQWVDNGPGWAVVQLATAEEVLALTPDFTAAPDLMIGAIGAWPAEASHDFELRSFAPGVDVYEDPVCGSMNASVGQWLTRTGRAGGHYLVSQGRQLGRTGEVTVDTDTNGTVWVGGVVTTLFRGTAHTA